MEKFVKALALAIGLLGLSAASLPAHAFQAQVPGSVVSTSNDVTAVQYYYRDDYRRYRRHRQYRDYDRGYRGGYHGGGPRRAPDAVIVTPNRPGVYHGNGFTVRQY